MSLQKEMFIRYYMLSHVCDKVRYATTQACVISLERAKAIIVNINSSKQI